MPNKNMIIQPIFSVLSAALLVACSATPESKSDSPQEYIGTTHPFAAEAVYFVMTDRFVDGDASNNHVDQGGEYPTFNLQLDGPDGQHANVGYMGGDYQGILDNAGYIRDMGFSAIWLSPIQDNPDQAFAGGEPIGFGGAFRDGGKTGYHGYWANNFWKEDEHWGSDNLNFKTYTQTLREQFGLKTVLDIVANHGSPSFTMPVDQPKFGEIYDIDGNLVADHQNIEPNKLDANNPMHQFFRHERDIAELSNLDDRSPAVREYLINAYLYWIEQGADAFRIDTIKHVPHEFWKAFSDRIRAEHPQFFMFGESFNFDANFIAQHTLPENGGISVLDFPGKEDIDKVFTHPESDFSELLDYLHLTDGPYANPYELTTFYDNHDMPRMNASDEGFIDAHNWLFTSRGIPVVYQGSEMGFMRGTAEHAGNRNYFGQSGVQQARKHPIHQQLTAIANIRKQTPALQRGLQLNVTLAGQQASFYRVLQTADIAQTALVLLNKGDTEAEFSVSEYMQPGLWTNALTGESQSISDLLHSVVAPHSVQVWMREGEIVTEVADLTDALNDLMGNK